jgi:hypothetical protein
MLFNLKEIEREHSLRLTSFIMSEVNRGKFCRIWHRKKSLYGFGILVQDKKENYTKLSNIFST